MLTFHQQDTYRAEWAWLILLAPERVPGMVTSMLNDYKEVSFSFWFLMRSGVWLGLSGVFVWEDLGDASGRLL